MLLDAVLDHFRAYRTAPNFVKLHRRAGRTKANAGDTVPPEYIVAVIIVAIVGLTITQVVKAIAATRQRHGPAGLEQLTAALEDLQSTQSDQAAQIAELQERADFAERVLAQTRDRAALEAQHKRE